MEMDQDRCKMDQNRCKWIRTDGKGSGQMERDHDRRKGLTIHRNGLVWWKCCTTRWEGFIPDGSSEIGNTEAILEI